MAQRTITGSSNLGKTIRLRRNELNLTIEEAASKAGVGTKTWSRYEAGESIRQDKLKGICKALNWHTFPSEEAEREDTFDLTKYKKHEAWSKFLEDAFGETAALSFAIGSDILLDHIHEDMEELSAMPPGSQIGQIDISFLKPYMPPQFLMKYDYDFLYALCITVNRLRSMARVGTQIIAHSVIEELALYLMVEFSRYLMEAECVELEDGWDDWIFDLFDDADLVQCLYSDFYLTPDHIYHFDHWLEDQFYTE